MQLITQAGDLGPKWFHVALRAIVLLAENDDIQKSGSIAERLGVDATYLRKIFSRLVKAHIVIPVGGRYGGYRLAGPACEISVKDIYCAMDKSTTTEFWTIPSTGSERYIALIVSKAEELFQAFLADYSIEDILKQKMQE